MHSPGLEDGEEEDGEELDEDLRAALQVSAQEHAHRDQLLRDEQRQLDEALRLSLLDKW